MGTSDTQLNLSITGITRRSSSLLDIGFAPGLVCVGQRPARPVLVVPRRLPRDSLGHLHRARGRARALHGRRAHRLPLRLRYRRPGDAARRDQAREHARGQQQKAQRTGRTRKKRSQKEQGTPHGLTIRSPRSSRRCDPHRCDWQARGRGWRDRECAPDPAGAR